MWLTGSVIQKQGQAATPDCKEWGTTRMLRYGPPHLVELFGWFFKSGTDRCFRVIGLWAPREVWGAKGYGEVIIWQIGHKSFWSGLS